MKSFLLNQRKIMRDVYKRMIVLNKDPELRAKIDKEIESYEHNEYLRMIQKISENEAEEAQTKEWIKLGMEQFIKDKEAK